MEKNKKEIFERLLLWVLVVSFSLAWGVAAALADDDDNRARLTGVTITGPDSVNENTTGNFTATASFSDGTTRDVTGRTSWSEDSSYASIDSRGVLTAREVSGNQTVTVTAQYRSGGTRQTARKTVTIRNGSASQVSLTGLAITGPDSVNENSTANYTATASFSDGTSSDVTSGATWSENSPYAGISSGVLTTQGVSGNQTVTLTAGYVSGGVTRTATQSVAILDAASPPPPTPTPPPLSGSHAGRFAQFEGTRTCLQCHEAEAREMHGSVHYQWKGDTRDLINPAAALEGKFGGINDFCIYPDINWIGKLTNVDGVQVDGGCAKCHAGLGDKPSPTVSQAQLENIDCLICHAPSYQRKVDTVNGVFRYVPDPDAMGMDILQAASDIRLPDKNACLNCHTKSGGGNNFKRGDIEEAHRNATKSFDVHMASTSVGGKGLECLDCHSSVGHRIAGRGSDLKGRDSNDGLDCLKCHSSTPHSNGDINKHTKRVNCTVCHIPTFAKGAPTDMERDWSKPGELDVAKRLYDPHMVKQSNVIPEYKFWNGQSEFYNFGDVAAPGPDGRIVMSTPIGDINTAGAKIYAFKHHLGNQPMDPVTSKLLPLKIGIFFQSNDIVAAVTEGAKGVGWPANGHTFAQTERYMGLFHEVAPKEQALQCNSCHGGNRLNFTELGYAPNSTRNGRPLCSSCHGSESASFNTIHSKHVNGEGYDCSTCHNFSKAQ